MSDGIAPCEEAGAEAGSRGRARCAPPLRPKALTCVQARLIELQAQACFAVFAVSQKQLVHVEGLYPTPCGRRLQVEARLEDLPAEEYEGIPSADLFFEDKVGQLYLSILCDSQRIAV